MAEEDRGAALMLSDLHGLRDASVGDSLQQLVFAPGSPFHRLPPLLNGLLLGQVDANPTFLTHEVRAGREPILPRRTGIQHLAGKLPVVTESQMRGRRPNADLLHQLRQHMAGELRTDSPVLALRRSRQQVAPDPVQPFDLPVTAVDPSALYLVELRHQSRRGQENSRLDARDPT